MTIVVTGAAGFIGSHVVERLLARGHEVVGVDAFTPFYDRNRKERNLVHAQQSPRFSLVAGDVREARTWEQVTRGRKLTAIVHLAGSAGVRPSVESPRAYVENNVEGTQAVLDAAVANGVGRVLLASSSSVYGNDGPRPSPEHARVDRPVSPYAASKAAAELLMHTAHHLHGVHTTCLRFFTAVGARQRPDLAVHKFAQKIAAGETITLYGDGSSERDYTHVDDVVDGVLLALDHAGGHHVYNLGAGRPVKLSDMVRIVGEALGIAPRIEVAPRQAGDVDATLADVSRARRELGFWPKRTLEQAAEELVRWMRAEALIT